MVLYWASSIEAVHAVANNDYSGMLVVKREQHAQDALAGRVYSRIFFFARLRPRLLFSVGALVRALQLCTPLKRVIDPTVGVGFGINFFAFVAGSRWVSTLILGFASTRPFWEALGAEHVQGAHVPITVTINDGRGLKLWGWGRRTKSRKPSEEESGDLENKNRTRERHTKYAPQTSRLSV